MPDQDARLPTETGSVIGEMVAGLDGLPPMVKGSLSKAVCRMLADVTATVTDLVTAPVKNVTARIKASTDGIDATAAARRIVKLEMANRVPEMIAANEALAERAVAFLGHEMIAEQANRERVLEHAIEDLRSAPPEQDPEGEIDDDWLHSFMKEASIKSAPEMQLLFGKILSGEIKRPGTFSIKAVRVLAMMSQATAKQFELLCNISVVVSDMVKVISPDGHPGRNSLQKYGLNFTALSNLTENDLIFGDFDTKSTWEPLAKLRIRFEYAGQDVRLETKEAARTGGLSDVRGVVFSNVGRELRQIVSMQPDPRYTSALIAYFDVRGCDLVKVTGKDEHGQFIWKSYWDLASSSG